MNRTKVNLSPSELQIRYQEALLRLANLDENDVSYEAKKMVAESRLSNLQEAWKDLSTWEQQGRDHEENLKTVQDNDDNTIFGTNTYQRPHSSQGTMILPTGFAPYAGSTVNTFGGHFASDGAMAGHGRPAQAPAWDFNGLSENTTGTGTPNPSNSEERPSSTSISSPASTFAVPRKRQRNSLTLETDSPGRAPKAFRPTPSPSMSGATSPSSYNSSDLPTEIPSDLYALFGGDPDIAAREFKESQREQEEHERAMKARREQERADEEFARALQEDLDSASVPLSLPRAEPINASAQTYLDSQGQYRRMDPISSSPAPILYEDPFASTPSKIKPNDPFRTSSLNIVKKENPYQAFSSGIVAQKEPSYQPASHTPYQVMSDGFINLDDDDDGDLFSHSAAPAAHPSSDLIETDFHSWLQSNGQALPEAYPARASDPVGVPGNRAETGSWNSLTDAARGLVNNVYNVVDQTISSLGTSARIGDTSVYGSNSAGPSRNIPIIDLDGFASQNIYERNLDRMGINPTDTNLVERYRQRYDYIAQDPTRTAREMKELLENIRPDEDLPPENREGTPAAMVYNLMEHQKLGLAWMKRMEEGTNRGGVLADDMGLGKTIQALALMSSRRSNNPACKTTLIVAPVALLRQWEREIEKKLKPGRQHSLSTIIFHGTKRETPWEKLRTFDVVLTTFGVLATEVKRRNDIEMAKKVNPNWRPTGTKDRLSLIGDDCHWYRVIIDEAQCIKNKKTRAALGCCMLQASTRFCMTGTPMMNNVGELYSLIRFLRIRPYCESEKFNHDIDRPLRSQSNSMRKKAMRQLQALLKSILLRRTKKSEIDGKPILDLPERTTTVQHAAFDEDEQSFYRALETQTQLQFNKYLKAGTIGRNYSNILVLLLRLRQACCHPHLIKDFGQTGGPTDLSAEDMINLAKELAPAVVTRIRDAAASNDFAYLECPVCMDPAENPTIFMPCGHDTCSECFARISDPSQAIAEGDATESRDVKCPSCRGKITPSRVLDLESFKKVHMPQRGNVSGVDDDTQAEVDTTDGSDSDDSDDDDDDDDVNANGDLRDFIVNDDGEAETTDDEEEEDVDEAKNAKLPAKLLKKKKRSKGKGKAKEKNMPKKTLAQLKKEAGVGSKARQKYLRKLEKDWIPSAKIEKVMEILRNVAEVKDEETKQGEKTIIFSQFTSLLDLLELPINKEGWNYRRYDGSMSPKARNDAVLEFTDKPNVKIMLVSLKAGNSGLNLVAASQVIIFDPFWNPYIEEQAIDRAHRIGQMRPVQVHRVLVPNTVEDRIITLQEKKRELIENALDEKASQSIGRLGVRELAFLFDVNH